MIKGTVSIPIATALAVLSATLAAAGVYFGTVNAQNEKVSEVKSDVMTQISTDRERITAVETDIKVIKDSQMETRTDLKELLRRVR